LRQYTALILNASQQDELVAISQSSLPAGYVFRAELILMLAEGASFRTIKHKLGTTAPTIVRWKERFLSGGIDGLDTHHPGQPPSVPTPAFRARILAATRKKPADGSTHWSRRKLAVHLGVSKDVVHRVWEETGRKPHRIEHYLASDDPDFESKAGDIIGLYLNSPQHAAVFFVDEKTAIQALDRLDPVLPLSPGRAERHGFEYYRHGTLRIFVIRTLIPSRSGIRVFISPKQNAESKYRLGSKCPCGYDRQEDHEPCQHEECDQRDKESN
jgi:transposase